MRVVTPLGEGKGTGGALAGRVRRQRLPGLVDRLVDDPEVRLDHLQRLGLELLAPLQEGLLQLAEGWGPGRLDGPHRLLAGGRYGWVRGDPLPDLREEVSRGLDGAGEVVGLAPEAPDPRHLVPALGPDRQVGLDGRHAPGIRRVRRCRPWGNGIPTWGYSVLIRRPRQAWIKQVPAP